MWSAACSFGTRLSSRLARLEARFHEHDQLLELQAKGSREIAEASDRVVEAMSESRTVDALRRDVVRLADDVRGEVGMSWALNSLAAEQRNRLLPMLLAYPLRRQKPSSPSMVARNPNAICWHRLSSGISTLCILNYGIVCHGSALCCQSYGQRGLSGR